MYMVMITAFVILVLCLCHLHHTPAGFLYTIAITTSWKYTATFVSAIAGGAATNG